MPFWPLCCESDVILFKKISVPVNGLESSYGKIPVTGDLGRQNRALGNRTSPASHINTSIFVQRKEWRGEISETEPAQFFSDSYEEAFIN